MTKRTTPRVYAPEHIDRAIAKLMETYNYFDSLPVDSLTNHIANGNNKIGRCLNNAVASGLSCGNCATCKYAGCYDLCDCVAHPNTVIPARAENLVLIRKDPDRFFGEFENRMTDRKKNHAGRFMVGGEWETETAITYANRTATNKPNWALWTYTKMHGLFNRWMETHEMAPNFSPMYSQWGLGHIIDNPYNMPVFLTLLAGEYKPAGFMWCPGNCEICVNEHIGCPYGYNVAIPLHGLPRLG